MYIVYVLLNVHEVGTEIEVGPSEISSTEYIIVSWYRDIDWPIIIQIIMGKLRALGVFLSQTHNKILLRT